MKSLRRIRMATKPQEDFFKDIWKKFAPLFATAIALEMIMGNDIAVTDAISQGVKTNKIPSKFSKKDQEIFIKKFEMNVKDANQAVSKQINNVILDNLARKGTNKELAEEIKQIFNENVAGHINYKNRFKTIATTESTNVLSIMSFNTAKKQGATGKYLSGVNDNRQGGDSKVALDKYGSPEQAIPLNEPFEFTFGKTHFSYLLPPNRPNDRERVLYTYD